MTTENSSTMIPIRKFVASKQIALFHTLKQPQFSGELILTDTKGIQSSFFLYMGRLMYGTKGIHPVRRWLRNLGLYAPLTNAELKQLKNSSYTCKPENMQISWDYDLLCYWVDKLLLGREEFTKITQAILAELFFDLTQSGEVTYEFKEYKNLPTPLVLMDADTVIVQAWKSWQTWQAAQLADRSPNTAPIIRNPEQLKNRTSPKTHEILIKLLNKGQTLRDLASQTRPDIVQLTRLLMPYVQLGLIELSEIADIPVPIPLNQGAIEPQNKTKENTTIACVDDSYLVLQTLEALISQAGYKFIGISDPIKAMSLFLEIKPDIIFLDLSLPKTNSYDICAQLRRLSDFSEIPIIMLGEHGNFIDRMRAKMVGATDFLLKPIDDEEMLAMLEQYF